MPSPPVGRRRIDQRLIQAGGRYRQNKCPWRGRAAAHFRRIACDARARLGAVACGVDHGVAVMPRVRAAEARMQTGAPQGLRSNGVAITTAPPRPRAAPQRQHVAVAIENPRVSGDHSPPIQGLSLRLQGS